MASPIVHVLLNENAAEAATAAAEVMAIDGFGGIAKRLDARWIADRIVRRFADRPELAREATREMVSALEACGRQEVALAWSLLLCMPQDIMSFWCVVPALKTMASQNLLDIEGPARKRQVERSINALQQCAEGKFVGESKSLWEILRPIVRDEDDEQFSTASPSLQVQRRTKPSGPSVQVLPAATLKSEHAGYKELVGAHVPLVVARDVVGIRAALRSEFPHAWNAIDLLQRDVREGEPIRCNAVLLTGPAGSSKSRLARRFGELLGLYAFRFDCASAADSQFGGVPRGWNSTMPSAPMRAVQQGGKANPLILLDEVEKASTSSHNGSLWSSLMPYTDRETSARMRDVSLDAPCDLSWCSYIATSNDDALLPPPLRDRFRVVNVPLPSIEHLPMLATNVIAAIEQQDGTEGFVEPLAEDELQVIGQAWKRAKFSMRAMQKIVSATIDARAQFAMRH